MIFLPIAPLTRLISHTRHSLLFHLHKPTHVAHKTHRLLLFRLSSPGAIPDYYSMEQKCPHLGADLGSADVEDLVITCPWHHYDFDLADNGKSTTGMRLCTYKVEVRSDGIVYVESPGLPEEKGWECVKFEPISEAFKEMEVAPMPDFASLDISAPSTTVSSPCSSSSTPAYARPPSKHFLAAYNNNSATSSSETDGQPSTASPSAHLPPPTSLLTYALLILQTPEPLLKISRTRDALAFLRSLPPDEPLVTEDEARWAASIIGIDTPPREEGKGGVRAPGRMGKRGNGGSEKSRSLMLHSLANIEQWAIDLAWDVIARFAVTEINGHRLPREFYMDWAKVAEDEAKHFSLLVTLLSERGVKYGDHSVHAGLWMSAQETAESLRARLAIIHMVHEARGLDVNPITIEKFRKAGDLKAVEALTVIHCDEVTHVTAGHRWFSWVCNHQGVDPVQTFREEVKLNFRGKLKGPFNEADRELAGLTRDFYEDLEGRGYEEDERDQQQLQLQSSDQQQQQQQPLPSTSLHASTSSRWIDPRIPKELAEGEIHPRLK